MNTTSSKAAVTTDNEVKIFNEGPEKFKALFEDIKKAKKEINIQYYIIKSDCLGIKLRDELTRKVKEGIKVRILYDGIGSRGMFKKFFKKLISLGGEVKIFFPSFLNFINFKLNFRNHRKVCIIDGEVAYIGGFNFGDEYLGLDKKYGYWRDTHLRIKGESVNHLQLCFIFDWNLVSNKKLGIDKDEFLFQGKSIAVIPMFKLSLAVLLPIQKTLKMPSSI
jgi:cardiolipin synthase